MDNPTWQDRISSIRDAGWLYADIARHCGISPQGLADIVSGKNKEPKGMVAVKLHKLHLRIARRAA